jgi:hypothetical protein
MVDTDGRLLVAQIHPADVQDRDGAVPMLKASRRSWTVVSTPHLTWAGARSGGRRG